MARNLEIGRNENLTSPHIPYIQRSTFGLIMAMERERKYSHPKEYTPFETNLVVSLSDALYTGKLKSAAETKKLIPKIKEGDLKDLDIMRYIKDLDYLYIYETKGIGGLNQRLLYLLSELKRGTNQENLIKYGNEFIDLIYRAIYLFPHEIRSIAVEINPDFKPNRDEFQYMEGRDAYPRLKAEYESRRGEELPQELILPLPFYYSTGTHGSGERKAQNSSYDDILLLPLSHKDKESITISLNLEEPFMTMPLTTFLIDEVNSIIFSESDKFTPWVNRGRGGLTERRHYLGHYLGFRNFAQKLSSEIPKMNDAERNAIRNLLSPNYGGELWEGDFGLLNLKKLIRGFFVEFASDIDDILLYEVNNQRLKSLFPEEASLNMFLSILRSERRLKKNTKVFKGATIINRLTSIPIKSEFKLTTPFVYGQHEVALLHLLDSTLDIPQELKAPNIPNKDKGLIPVFNS